MIKKESGMATRENLDASVHFLNGVKGNVSGGRRCCAGSMAELSLFRQRSDKLE